MTHYAAPIAISYPTEPVLKATDATVSEAIANHDNSAEIRERTWGMAARVDSSVSFEEYQYWAKIERALEHEENKRYVEARGPSSFKSLLKDRFSKGTHNDTRPEIQEAVQRSLSTSEEAKAYTLNEKQEVEVRTSVEGGAPPAAAAAVSDTEWRNASRALRTTGWGTMFYLITTDILGWSGAPNVFASVGFGPGIALYVIFGICAGYSGWILWRVFLGLDSSRYPMCSFGDPFFRVYGKRTRHFINVMQSLQQFLTVAVLILGQATTLEQIAKEKICFVVAMIVIMVVGMIGGSIRSLQRLGWLCNASVWMNIINFFIIIIVSAVNPPDYQAVFSSTILSAQLPKKLFAGPPPPEYQLQTTNEFAAQFNGVNTMVYAYSGLLLFVAFLAEMRHPWDFYKGLFAAQGFICVVYIFFGAFVYGNLGQYAISNIGNVITPYSIQTVGNVLTLLTGFIAIILYFNIGMKTVYLEVFQEILHFPAINTKAGKTMWLALGPVYWILALVVAASVPNLNGVVSIVGGLFSLNFTYSIPAVLFLGYNVTVGAQLPGEGFDPVTRVTTRHDSGFKRYQRGFFKHPIVNCITLAYFLAGLAASGMGSWAAIEGLISVFGPGGTVATSWGCAVPV